MEVRPGSVIGGTYEILGPLGRGGMGELYKARNTRTERRVALKLLHPDAKARADAIERFRREARAAGLINSDHVTQVLDIQDDPEQGIAIAFELLEGENLLDRLRRKGVMNLETLHPLVDQVLRGLCDAHAQGIVHRDLKPSNIFLERRPDGTERVKILDFGISKLPKTMAKTTLTEPGQALGSFMFMPPEQIQKAANVDHRADLYALGTLVFQAMTGHLPYASAGMVDLVRAKTTSEARTLDQVAGTAFPPALQAWVSRCLRRAPSERFQSAVEAAAAWRALVSAPAPPAYGGGYSPPVNLTQSASQFPQGGVPPSVPPSAVPPSAPPQPGYAPLPPRPVAMPAPMPIAPQPSHPPSSVPPVAQAALAPAASARSSTTWLLLLAVALVVAASGVMVMVVYTLVTTK